MKRPFPVLLLISVVTLLSSGAVRAQGSEQDIQFRLAQSYERSGDIESAARIYEQLYAKDSGNVIVFDALRRSYMQLKKYPETVELINRKLARQPKDMMLLSQLGRVYSFLSDEARADEAWEKAIAIAPATEATYRIVAGAVMENRLFDKAIRIYLRGRKALNKPDLFAADLAYLYSAAMNYPEATREYLNIVRADPNQFPFVQSRIAGFTGRPEGLSAAVAETESHLRTEPQNDLLLAMLSWLYMEGDRYDDAFELERKIDAQRKSGGLQIFTFAERALREHAVSAAAKAYQEVITKYPGFPMMPQAKFGYARTLEDSSALQDTLQLFKGGAGVQATPASEAEPAFRGAIAAYRAIADEHAGTEIAARSLLQIGKLMYERFFNLDEARTALEAITARYKGFVPVLMEAQFLLGEVALAGGDLGKAEGAYNALLTTRTISRELLQKTQLRLAELAYYRTRFSEAVNGLQGLTKNAADNITNDALGLLLFVQENLKADSTALAAFAHADLLQHQRKLSEALVAQEAIRAKYASTPLIDEVLMNIGDIHANMGRYAEAVAAYDSLIAGFPESIVLDRAMMKIARIYQGGLRDKQKAVDAYQQLLIKYPNSIFGSEARKAIRELRGETL